MRLAEALARLAECERDVIAALAELFPAGSALALDLGTDEAPNDVQGVVVAAGSLFRPGEMLGLQLRLGAGRGVATVSLNDVMERGMPLASLTTGGA